MDALQRRPRPPPAATPALIRAAGRGERLRRITDTCTAPVAEVGEQPPIAWQLHPLGLVGMRRVVIDVASKGQQIADANGHGSMFGLQVRNFEGGWTLVMR